MARRSKLKRSNAAHRRCWKVALDKNDFCSTLYHGQVLQKQRKQNRVLSESEKKQVYKAACRINGK